MSRAPSATCTPGSAATSTTSPAASSLGHLRARLGGDLGHLSIRGRSERVLHLHRLDDGEALALLDLVARRDEDGDELAVHRRLDGAAFVDVLEVDRERVVEFDPSLVAVSQDDDGVPGVNQKAAVYL